MATAMATSVKHGNGNDTWQQVSVNERNQDGNFVVESGDSFKAKTAVFVLDRHNATGNFYPVQSTTRALISDVGYLAAVVPAKALTVLGNLAWGLSRGAVACKDVWTKRSEADFKALEAFKPALRNFWYAAKDASIFAFGYGLCKYGTQYKLNPTWHGVSLFTGIVSTLVGVAVLCSLYNPKGTKIGINEAEQRWNVKPLSNEEVRSLGFFGKVTHIADGSYSLSRLLQIHRVGNLKDTVGSTKRFEYVEVKKDK